MKHTHRLLTLPVLLLGGLGFAQAPAADSPGGVEVQEPRFQRHILHLAGGEVIRARARRIDGAWEVQRGGRTFSLAASAVERAVREREVLARSRELERELGRDDPLRRVAFAQWLVDAGLLDESLEQLDRVLRAHPDQTEALALIERSAPPILLPTLDVLPSERAAALGAFLRTAAGARPSAREIAVNLLRERRGELDLQAVLERELVSDSARRRRFAALALRRIYPGRAIRGLLARAILDGSGDVRRGAALALASADDPAVLLPAIRALGSPSSSVRGNAAEALGNMGYPGAVAPLFHHLTHAQASSGSRPPASHIFVGRQIAYVQDYDVEVAQFEAIADPQINTLTEGAVLDVRVLSVRAAKLRTELATTRRALAQLTGASPGHTTAAWTRWWAEHGAEWTAPTPPDAPPSPTSPAR